MHGQPWSWKYLLLFNNIFNFKLKFKVLKIINTSSNATQLTPSHAFFSLELMIPLLAFPSPRLHFSKSFISCPFPWYLWSSSCFYFCFQFDFSHFSYRRMFSFKCILNVVGIFPIPQRYPTLSSPSCLLSFPCLGFTSVFPSFSQQMILYIHEKSRNHKGDKTWFICPRLAEFTLYDSLHSVHPPANTIPLSSMKKTIPSCTNAMFSLSTLLDTWVGPVLGYWEVTLPLLSFLNPNNFTQFVFWVYHRPSPYLWSHYTQHAEDKPQSSLLLPQTHPITWLYLSQRFTTLPWCNSRSKELSWTPPVP